MRMIRDMFYKQIMFFLVTLGVMQVISGARPSYPYPRPQCTQSLYVEEEALSDKFAQELIQKQETYIEKCRRFILEERARLQEKSKTMIVGHCAASSPRFKKIWRSHYERILHDLLSRPPEHEILSDLLACFNAAKLYRRILVSGKKVSENAERTREVRLQKGILKKKHERSRKSVRVSEYPLYCREFEIEEGNSFERLLYDSDLTKFKNGSLNGAEMEALRQKSLELKRAGQREFAATIIQHFYRSRKLLKKLDDIQLVD